MKNETTLNRHPIAVQKEKYYSTESLKIKKKKIVQRKENHDYNERKENAYVQILLTAFDENV